LVEGIIRGQECNRISVEHSELNLEGVKVDATEGSPQDYMKLELRSRRYGNETYINFKL